MAPDRSDNLKEQNSAAAKSVNNLDPESTAGVASGTSQQAPSRFEAGTLFNERYEILRLLGRGGMGEVYLASDKRINRQVALKVLHPNLVSSNESLRRFTQEAQAVSALNHPHIMTIHEVDSTPDGTLFFVAEYVDGQILRSLLRKGRLELSKALEVAIQVSSALSAAHEAGITHRDIKPENIIVRRDEYIKVLDFGLAKLTHKQTSTTSAGPDDPTQAFLRTKPGAAMGTPAYMSPEQARGVQVDARTDIWSLGVVMYEMLTAHRPFTGETSTDTMVSVIMSEPPPISSYVDLPSELEWIVSKAISKDLEGRYQTAKELRADLEKIKKRIEFDQNLNRSANRDSLNDREKPKGTVPSTADSVIATARESPRPTSSKLGETLPLGSPGFGGVLQRARAHKVVSALVALALVPIVSSVAYLFLANTGKEQIDSIAVLPFENVEGNSDLTYIADGLSESLIDRLSQLPQLKVISRNSSFKFRGANIDPRDVASQLGVRAILTGSISQIGDDLHVRFDIIDVVENRQLTGGNYRRKAGDILQIQNEIAQTASEHLRLKLTNPQSKRLAENGTENSEAYRYYLNGLVELNGPQDVRGRALEYFERAIQIDPDFAAAHTEIAWVYWSRANASSDPNELMPKAKGSVLRALEIDPELAKSHVVRAMVYEYEFDWSKAESEYRRAIELSPNLDFARNNYAFFLSVKGRHDDALAELEQQSIRDPINQRMALLQKGIVLTQARRFDQALQAYQSAQVLDPSRDIPNFSLGYAYAGKGFYNEAAGYYKKSADLMGGEDKYSQPLVYLAATYAKMPAKRGEAIAILKKIEAMDEYVSPAVLAAVYTALDDRDKAIALLEQAYIKRDLLLRFIGTGYEYDGLRRDPRFVDLIKRIGLG